jgi:hypothetical protein
MEEQFYFPVKTEDGLIKAELDLLNHKTIMDLSYDEVKNIFCSECNAKFSINFSCFVIVNKKYICHHCYLNILKHKNLMKRVHKRVIQEGKIISVDEIKKEYEDNGVLRGCDKCEIVSDQSDTYFVNLNELFDLCGNCVDVMRHEFGLELKK